MRQRGGDDALWSTSQYDVYGRVYVEGIPLHGSLSINPLLAATWDAAADQLVGTATITLASRDGEGNNLGLDPFGTSSLAAERPEPGKLIDLRTATVAKGATPGDSDYVTVFDGEIDSVDAASLSEVVLTCRDGMAFYADRIIEPPEGEVYGYPVTGGSMESVLQTLAAVWDSFTDPLGPNAAAVVVEGDPEWTVLDFYQQAGGSIAEAMHAVVLQRGWALHWRHHALTGRGNPTAYDPERAGATDGSDVYVLSGPQEIIRFNRLSLDRTRVRNVIEIMYGEERTRLKTEDTTSIADYGRRYMLFSEDATSQVNTAEEAQRMLDGALLDLKDPGVLCDYERTYFWGVELGDNHQLPAPHLNGNPVFNTGVIGYSHSLDWRAGGAFRTIIRTADRSKAARLRWFKLEPRMVHVSLTEPIGMAPEGAEWYMVENIDIPA